MRGVSASSAPRGASSFVATVCVAALTTTVGALVAIVRDTMDGGYAKLTLPALAASGLVAAALLVVQGRPMTLRWREHKLVTTLDEAPIIVGLLLLPAPFFALSMGLASAIGQALRGPAARIKRVFNAAQYSFAAASTVAIFLLLLALGLPALAAAAIAALSFSVTANLLLSGVFARLADVPALQVYRERFLLQGLSSSLVGASAGVSLVALWTLHPLAMLAGVPFAYLVARYGALYAASDREVEVHRRLARATHDLVGSASVRASVARVLEECEELLDCGRAEVRVDLREGRLEMAREAGPHRRSLPLVASLPGRSGAVGEITVWPRLGKPAFAEHERALLRTVAGSAASAIENARAIAEAEASRERLDAYLSHAQDAVLLVEPAGTIEYVNPAAQRLFGLDPGEASRCRAADLFDERSLQLALGLLPGQPLLMDARANTLRGERTFDVEVHAGRLAEAGRVSGVLMLVRDVSERKRMEEEMARQREALAQNEKLSTLGTLVAGVAHEINNPLTYMRGNLELLVESIDARVADDATPSRERELLEELAAQARIALEGAGRISEIADSLKNVARRGTAASREEDLNRIVRDVVSVVRAGLPGQARLELELAPDLPTVLVRGGEVHQVVLNLVKNAAEAVEGKAAPRVRVRTYATQGRVCLEVEDNGCGIPPDVEAQLFTPFFTTKERGTGLGLSLSRGIAESHGGELVVAATSPEGTRLRFALPLRAPEEVVATELRG